ncbi:ubiquitin thioesterase OTU1-like [Halichondria panicea]|uniref:ubiquitin thioesterase OTU1-like n=1 Tax=Halichondria panicea TaxID=6063 RepID=UPI00312B70F6
MILSVKTKTGRLVINDLSETSTFGHLQSVLKQKTSISPPYQKILYGYPPQPISSSDTNATLQSLAIQSGETLILESHDNAMSTPTGNVQSDSTASGSRPLNKEMRKLSRKVVPADNSCLFKSISLLLCNGVESSKELRELVGGIVLSDPGKYHTALLGRDSSEYVKWLLREESWGGAIEVSVFSEHYQTELDVVDIQTQRIDRFGEDKGYSNRALLLYDGIHYDPLLMEGGDGNTIQSLFLTSDETILVEAVQIAKSAFDARRYTDLAGFSLRCMVCGKALTGQTDAQDHAQTTGHINFGEV